MMTRFRGFNPFTLVVISSGRYLLTFVRNDFFISDQKIEEQKESGETKNKSHRKINTRNRSRRIEGVVCYNLPSETGG
jgi:hypothetical protein